MKRSEELTAKATQSRCVANALNRESQRMAAEADKYNKLADDFEWEAGMQAEKERT